MSTTHTTEPFDHVGAPVMLLGHRLRLSAAEMVAALADFSAASREELATLDQVRGEIEYQVLEHGMRAIYDAACVLDTRTPPGQDEWVDWCRTRVAVLLTAMGPGVQR